MLEPLQAGPVIIEDNCFVGARSEVAEGVIVREGAVLSMGVFIGASTKIVDRDSGKVFQGEVPAYSVVVPGTPAGNRAKAAKQAPDLLRRHRQARRREDAGQDQHQRTAAGLNRRPEAPMVPRAQCLPDRQHDRQARATDQQRFPDAGLVKVCHDLLAIAQETQRKARRIARPNLAAPLLVVAILGGLAGLAFVALVATQSIHPQMGNEVFGIFQGIDAAMNIAVLAGAALFFAVSLEDRIKRRRSLRDLYVFRSIAHVIDMHQLTKDPGTLLGRGPATASSPRRTMSKYELTRYLDYCSEMQSLTGKLAALYAQNLPDPVVIDAVNDIEELTANFSRKVWQKISILESYDRAAAPYRNRRPSRVERRRWIGFISSTASTAASAARRSGSRWAR